MQTIEQSRGIQLHRGFAPHYAAHFGAGLSGPDDNDNELSMSVLADTAERLAIADLRTYAAFGVEQDLGLDLAPYEEVRDAVGLVTALHLRGKVIATLRFVPTGHGLTGAERLPTHLIPDRAILGHGSWEVGRVIMAPEDRHPELLHKCLAVTLAELIKIRHVRHFHATTTMSMARLWRPFGMNTVVTMSGASGKRYALVHGLMEDVASALNVPSARLSTRWASSRAGRPTLSRSAALPVT